MLPETLVGPGEIIGYAPYKEFLEKNLLLFPNLDPDFILQICFEHPERFNNLFPDFNPDIHSALRVTKTAKWVFNNVYYNNGEQIDFWSEQFDNYLKSNEKDYEIFVFMNKHKIWPFPPVIIEAQFAMKVGAPKMITGKPYYLIEGTHRVSYLRRMQELGMVKAERIVELIQIMPRLLGKN